MPSSNIKKEAEKLYKQYLNNVVYPKLGKNITYLTQLNKVGKGDGTTQSLVAGNDVGTGASAWQGVGIGDAIMCANPFGRQVEINLRRSDLQDKLALAQFGFPAVDVGIYSLQFTITMMQNN